MRLSRRSLSMFLRIFLPLAAVVAAAALYTEARHFERVEAALQRSKALELLIGKAPSCANRLIGDALRLEQIPINLTGNAIKFTERGEVEVSVTMLEAFDRSQENQPAAAADRHRRIFDPFAQADGSTTRNFGGSGLVKIDPRSASAQTPAHSALRRPLPNADARAAAGQPHRPRLAGLHLPVADESNGCGSGLARDWAHPSRASPPKPSNQVDCRLAANAHPVDDETLELLRDALAERNMHALKLCQAAHAMKIRQFRGSNQNESGEIQASHREAAPIGVLQSKAVESQ